MNLILIVTAFIVGAELFAADPRGVKRGHDFPQPPIVQLTEDGKRVEVEEEFSLMSTDVLDEQSDDIAVIAAINRMREEVGSPQWQASRVSQAPAQWSSPVSSFRKAKKARKQQKAAEAAQFLDAKIKEIAECGGAFQTTEFLIDDEGSSFQIYRFTPTGFAAYEVQAKKLIEEQSLKPLLEDSKDESSILSPIEEKKSRAVAAMLGMAIGDALGMPTEFFEYKHDGIERPDDLPKPGEMNKGTHHAWKMDFFAGQFTDDTSLGLCLADSLLAHEMEADFIDLQVRFYLWRYNAYNAGFGDGLKGAVGIGGTIRESLNAFEQDPSKPYTQAGDPFTSGNGGLMRLVPSVLRCSDNLEQAMDLAEAQNAVTHKGYESRDLARLMAFIIWHGIQGENKEQIFARIDKGEFKCSEKSVRALALSQAEWNWKSKDWRPNAERSQTYLGSYAMDGLSMALHRIWHSTSFSDAVMQAAYAGGDSDSVAAITGQVAGAVYGLKQVPLEWIKAVEIWHSFPDEAQAAITAKALMLFEKRSKPISFPPLPAR